MAQPAAKTSPSAARAQRALNPSDETPRITLRAHELSDVAIARIVGAPRSKTVKHEGA
jgi:hypothetical protein